MSEDRNCLSWWFPKLEAACLPVPKTIILTMPVAAQEDFFSAFDGTDSPDGGVAVKAFGDQVRAAVAEVGGPPAFLRTGHTSGKHNWSRTCFLSDPALAESHLFAIIEFSEICDLMGLPWSTWAVREMLPTKVFGSCAKYGGMPVAREFRFFVDGGEIRCWHPYWPDQSLVDGGATEAVRKAVTDGHLTNVGEANRLYDVARRAGAALGGAWSVDILDTRLGWYVTDCALAEDSWHWPGCPYAKRT